MDSNSSNIAKGKKRSVWCDNDAQVLLELWADRATDLRRAKRNRHIYKDISVQMNNKFSSEEVHVKIRNFTQKYREEKKEMGSCGGSSSNWKYYNAVHRIIGNNAANNPDILETFSFVNTPDASCQPSPESPVSQALPSPVMISSPRSSPLDTTFSSAAGTSSSGKKRNHLGDMVKMMKVQNEMLKRIVEDSQSLSNEIVIAIQEQNANGKEFINLVKTLIEKI